MSTPSLLDLSNLTRITEVEDAGIWIDIRHPNGEPLKLGGQDKPFRVKMAGAESSRYRQAVKVIREENMRRAEPLSDVEEAAQLPGFCTLEWEGAFQANGTEIPLSREHATQVYTAGPFIADQAVNGMFNHTRFFPVSSPAL